MLGFSQRTAGRNCVVKGFVCLAAFVLVLTALASPIAHLRLGALFVMLTAAPGILFLNQKGRLFP